MIGGWLSKLNMASYDVVSPLECTTIGCLILILNNQYYLNV